MVESTDHIEVQVTCGSRSEADAIAKALVDGRKAACVQQVPIRSTYRWEGRVEHDDEILLLVKTRRDLFAEVEASVTSMHSYEVPAITAVDITVGANSYLAWIDTETQ